LSDYKRVVIVVATNDFRLYHEAVNALRDRGVSFTTVTPGETLPKGTTVVLTAETDPIDINGQADIEQVYADPDDIRPAIEDVLTILRTGDDRLIVGVDPGPRPGIVVMSGDTVVAAFQVPVTEAVSVIAREVADTENPLVRIGDGARLHGARIINELTDVTIELVDETGTTPYLGAGARGAGDILAATNIAQIEGEQITTRVIEPTAGELQRIQNESRVRSGGDRTISASLAHDVAVGALTIEEALSEHENQRGS